MFFSKRKCGNCDHVLIKRKSFLYCENCIYSWRRKTLNLVEQFRKPTPEGSEVSVIWEPNGTLHQDILLKAGPIVRRCDSYYYDLDHVASTEESIKSLLNQWTKLVKSAVVGETIYLPYGFDDEYTEWLKCDLLPESSFEIIFGMSHTEGWSFMPSDFIQISSELSDFETTDLYKNNSLTITQKKLLEDIELSSQALEKT